MNPSSLLSRLALLSAGAAFVACGAPPPGARSATEVASAGMTTSFVGKTKCNPKSAERPFVVEWDATDVSTFQARTATDVVFVRYEGCDLEIVEGCTVDDEKGHFGSYRPVEWTSGSLESLAIEDEGDLYAKLPLGAASLGARVRGGEKFRMEYYVSGTRRATRSSFARRDLASVAACRQATHFVYGINLGAFALGASTEVMATAGVSAFGFGAGGSRSRATKADKRGGDLTTCKGVSAKELDTCKVPIRLTLREIVADDAAPVEKEARPAEEPKPSATKAFLSRDERERRASALYASAAEKSRMKDGRSCLADLDEHDKLDPRPQYLSTAPAFAITRVQCLMLAGQCGAGKVLARKMVETFGGMDAASVDGVVEGYVASYCQGARDGGMSPRDELLAAKNRLDRGANVEKTDVASCRSAYETVQRLAPKVPKDDRVALAVEHARAAAASCMARAGDCRAARGLYASSSESEFRAIVEACRR